MTRGAILSLQFEIRNCVNLGFERAFWPSSGHKVCCEIYNIPTSAYQKSPSVQLLSSLRPYTTPTPSLLGTLQPIAILTFNQ